jgi:hypothetical protein
MTNIETGNKTDTKSDDIFFGHKFNYFGWAELRAEA